MTARRLCQAAAFAATLTASFTAAAFCRTTSCDPNDPGPNCRVEDGCLVGGLDLFWKGRCVTFTVQQDGSATRNISYENASQIISDAFRSWMFADCGGDRPSLDVIDLGKAVCDEVEYNIRAPNANIWMFRDRSWPYADNGHTLALTTITFNVDTGEIFDADVELNAAQNNLTLPGQSPAADLLSIATHEAGHFLGLSHSPMQSATMYAQYAEGDTSLRVLDSDDVAGICEIYPPNSGDGLCIDEPRHGFSRKCAQPPDDGGCATCGLADGSGTGGWLVLALGALGVGVRRAKRRRCGRSAALMRRLAK